MTPAQRLIRAACDLRTIFVLVLVFAVLLLAGCAANPDHEPVQFNGRTYYYAESLAPGESCVIYPDGRIVKDRK